MKIKSAIAIVLAVVILCPALLIAKEKARKAPTELEILGKKWNSYSPCQKLFILGYSSYIEGRFKEAKKRFEVCDGKYPLLQNYISGFIKKADAGGESFSYLDKEKENAEAISGLKKELSSMQKDDDRYPRVAFDLAKAYFKGRQYKTAMEIFNKTAEYGSLRLSSLEYIATSLARQERYDEAINTNERIIEEFSKNTPAKAKAIYKIGFLYLDNGRYREAEDMFRRLQKVSAGYQRGQVEWYLAWCAYKTGDYDKAIGLFSTLLKKGGKDWQKRALYWKAMAMMRSGDKEDADKLFEKIYEDNKVSYYGLLSAKRLNIKDIELPSKLAEAEDMVEEEDFANDGDSELLATAYELDKLGLSELVVDELDELIRAKKKQLPWDAVRKLAVKNHGWYLLYPRISYPKAYDEIVKDAAPRTGVDPYFAWAIMREESTFRPKVVSKSGAVGLMQLMPFTAKRMSPSSYRIEHLFIPRLNINAGVKYLSFLLKRYHNNMYLAAAGYNAGEEAVDRWVSGGFPSDQEATEEFVEEIPYKETNDYVKKVMKSYWVYKTNS